MNKRSVLIMIDILFISMIFYVPDLIFLMVKYLENRLIYNFAITFAISVAIIVVVIRAVDMLVNQIKKIFLVSFIEMLDKAKERLSK